MNTVTENALQFMKLELQNAQIEVSANESGRESFKILKHELGELNDNLFIALVLIIEKQPRVVYIIPCKEIQDSNNNFFINNEVSLMPIIQNIKIIREVHY